ncbi:MAG: hypothetical protein V4812_14760 [Pseudomonadota bacterium]
MFSRTLFVLFFLFSLLNLGACSLDRTGLAAASGTFAVTPTLACPGDTVTLTWDLRSAAPQPGFCRFSNGFTPSLQRCASSAECSEGGQCIDGSCNRCALIGGERTRVMECAVPSSGGCPPNMNARIELEPEPEPPLERASDIWDQPRGERQFVVQAPTAVAFFSEVIDIEGQRAGLARSLERFDARGQVELVDPDLTRTPANGYECRGMPSWSGVLLEELFAVPSPTLRLLNVRNPNPFAVVVNGLSERPFTLGPREARALDLPVLGRVGARPDQAFLNTLPPVLCSAVRNEGRYPDAPLELTVGCPPRLIEPPKP